MILVVPLPRRVSHRAGVYGVTGAVRFERSRLRFTTDQRTGQLVIPAQSLSQGRGVWESRPFVLCAVAGKGSRARQNVRLSARMTGWEVSQPLFSSDI